MAKGQHLSSYQQGIVKRYYENKDTIATQKLGEIVGELYLAAGDAKKSDKLWKSAHTALLNAKATPSRVDKICAEKNLEALAKLVNELF